MNEDRDDEHGDRRPDDRVRYTNVYAVLQGDMGPDRGASQMDEEIQRALATF